MAPKRRQPKGTLSRCDPWKLLAGSGTVGAETVAQVPIAVVERGHIVSSSSSSLGSAGVEAKPKIPDPPDARERAYRSMDIALPAPIVLLAERRDRPVIAPTKRGSAQLALDATSDSSNKRVALEALHRDMYSATSRKPRDSHLRTWQRFHDQWFGSEIPMIPLTVAKIVGVGAVFKAGRYRGFANPLACAKELHIELGCPWTDQLAQICKKVDRSVTRGIGPASQCGSLDLNMVADLGLGDTPLVKGGPIGPAQMIIAGSFFMLREVEASLAVWQSITLDPDRSLITWILPASKTDPKALGKTRSWGCVCTELESAETSTVTARCPYRAILRQRAAVCAVLECRIIDLGCVPVFPALDGTACSKEAVVATFRGVGTLLGKDETAVAELGGHLCRVTGAQHLARLGFDVVLIRLMARWSPDVVLRYIAEAPLGTVTETYRKLAAGRSMSGQLDSLFTEMSELRSRLDTMSVRATEALVEETALEEAVVEARPFGEEYLVNHASGKFHLQFRARDGVVDPWKAKCGWRYKELEADIATVLPLTDHTMICGVCLPRQRRAAMLASKQVAHAGIPDSDSS